MGGGGIKKSQSDLQGIADQQKAFGAQSTAAGTSRIAEGDALNAPMVDFLHKIIGGDSTTTAQALAPAIKTITANNSQTKERILQSTPPGAARDYALAANEREKGAQVAEITNDTYLKAFPALSGLAQQQYGTGLQQTGAGLTSTGQAGQSTSGVLQSKDQQKAATLGLVGSLAGAAGTAAGGYFGKK